MPDTATVHYLSTRHRAHYPDPRRCLWAVAIALYLGGDLATTWMGFQLGAPEAHPLAQAVLAAGGLEAALLLKCLTVGLVALLARIPRDATWAWGPPIGLCLTGLGITVWNGYVLLVLSGAIA